MWLQVRWSEFTKLELLNAAKYENFSHDLAFPVWRIRMHMNECRWNKKCSLTFPCGQIVAILNLLWQYVIFESECQFEWNLAFLECPFVSSHKTVCFQNILEFSADVVGTTFTVHSKELSEYSLKKLSFEFYRGKSNIRVNNDRIFISGRTVPREYQAD